ncbi:MAG TPA: PfkB family carbohydrate kinase [Anaerolineae bacterium]|nr:PfkB family carbohydrate kinase [Anaerolineae bacterium]
MSVEQRTGECFDAIVIGDLAVDELVVHGETTVATGGSVYYGAVAMARLGMRTAVVTRLAERDFGRLDELRAAGITVYAHAAPESSGIRNVYLTADQDRRICTPLGYAGPFSLAEMPAASARYTVIGPLMAGLVDLDLVRALAARGALALDAQGFLRQREGGGLALRDWPEKALGLPLVSVLKVDQAEAEVLTGELDARTAAMLLAGWGAREVLLTHATGVTVCAEGRVWWAPFVPRGLNGRTGRGDTCLAAYLARRLTAGPAEACRFAAAVTSLKLEVPGPLQASAEEIARLYAELEVKAI